MTDATPLWPHGDVSDAELREHGLDPATCLDFAVNVDPLGPHPAVAAAFRSAAVHRYPDPEYRTLRRALADRDHVAPEAIAIGPGTSNLLWMLLRSFAAEVGPRRLRVVLDEPTFAEVRRASEAAGAEIAVVPRRAADQFALRLDAATAVAEATRADVVLLARPHNPSGRNLTHADLVAFAQRHADRHVVVDEAFLRLSHEHASAVAPVPENVWRLRSLTKELGMPGLRVGYLAGHVPRVRRFRATQPPWEVGHPASVAAEVGVRDPGIVAAVRSRMLADTAALQRDLRAEGYDPLPTDTIFTLVEVGNATLLRTTLMQRGLLVRDCASFGLPRHLRLCGRSASDRQHLLAALRAWRGVNAFHGGSAPRHGRAPPGTAG